MDGVGARRKNGDLVYSLAGHENARAWAVCTPNMASVLFSEQQPISIAIRVLIVATVRQSSTILHWVVPHHDVQAIKPRPFIGGKMVTQTKLLVHKGTLMDEHTSC